MQFFEFFLGRDQTLKQFCTMIKHVALYEATYVLLTLISTVSCTASSEPE